MMTPITTSNNNSQMHNEIMATGSKERPPILATGRYAQKLAYFDAEDEVIHLILIGIGDDIYSIVDACTTAKEMWIAIERLQQARSLNKQYVKTNNFWEFGKFTSRDGESIESYYSMFFKTMNEIVRNKLEVATMQYQNEVNEICVEKLARNKNPLAFVATAQHYPEYHNQAPKPNKSIAHSSKQTTTSKLHASTRHKGKEIAKPFTPPSESASDKDSDLKQAQRDKNKNMDATSRSGNGINTEQFVNQRTVTVVGARETVGNQVV
ncbi:hypothetical protein Tco_0809250 [Tanacetum coccineum]